MGNNFSKRVSKVSRPAICALSIAMTLSLIFSLITPLPIDAATARSTYNTNVAAGSEHYLVIDAEGNVWAFGSNNFGQLGDGSLTKRDSPVKVYSYEWQGKAISVAAGSQQSLVLLENGNVLQWGYNNLSNPIHKLVPLDGKAVEISAGEDTCMAILESGNAVIWSNIMDRRFIRKDEGNAYIPNVKEISVGSNEFILLRDAAGYVYTVNVNDYTAQPVQREVLNTSALAGTFASDNALKATITPGTVTTLATVTPSTTPVATITPETTISPDPTVTPEPTVSPEPTPTDAPVYEDLSNVVGIAAGRNFGVALLASGDVYTWGNPQNGLLGYPSIEYMEYAQQVDLPGPVKAISAGFEHTITVLESNTKYGWGRRTSLGLNPSSGNFTGTPVELGIATGVINQISSGGTGNLIFNNSGEFMAWGQGMALRKLELTENLFLVEKPEIKSIFVGKDMITVEWNVSDYYTEMLNGFVIKYSMPDGTEARTQLLPVTQGNINLRGLQPETNYTLTLTAYGKTGFEQTTESTVVMTLKPDAEVSPTPTDAPTPTPTEDPGSESSEELSSEPDPIDEEPATSIFGIILIILAALILITAITAIIFVWKKIDREENSKIKPVRVVPIIGDGIDEYDEDGEYAEYPDDETGDNDTDLKNKSVNAMWNDDEDINQIGGNPLTPDENGVDTNESVLQDDDLADDDDFLTRRPKAHKFEPDDDDFIIKKP